MECEVCGKPALTQALIEGARLSVCRECARLGQELLPKTLARTSPYNKGGPAGPMEELLVVENYASLISGARNSLGLDVAALALRLSINADYLRQIEAGRKKPDERTAKKLESALKIRLIALKT